MDIKPYIAEIHDIGKLADKVDLKKENVEFKGHTFFDFDFSQISINKPLSPSWYGQYHHEIEDLTLGSIPKDYIANVFLTKIADGLASSISRALDRGGYQTTDEGLYKLWNPKFYETEIKSGKKWSAFNNKNEFKLMFKIIETIENSDEFLYEYRDNLILTPEDKSFPKNVTSLLTHLELVGKIYRILKKHIIFDTINNKVIYNGIGIKEFKERDNWIYRFIQCKIIICQSLSRLQDLNVFRKRIGLLNAMSNDSEIKDYVMFFTDDTICLFVPVEDEIKIQDLLKQFLDSGFAIDYKEMEAELGLLTSSMERALEKFRSSLTTRHLKLYERRLTHYTKPEFPPPICDSCQMREAKERIKDQVHEYLCDICYEIREMGEPAKEYAEWEEQGLKSAWMKISLDQDQLEEALIKLFREYVDNNPKMKNVADNIKREIKEAFRPLAVKVDFIRDYKQFLKAFREKVYKIKKDDELIFSESNFLYPINDYNEFGMFKVNSGESVLSVINLFLDLLNYYFPKCINERPIKLSISIANVKYPYLQHWRFLSTPKDIINIQIPESIKLNVNIDQYKLLTEKIGERELRLSHFLYQLSKIETETNSNMIVLFEILSNRKKFPVLLELTQQNLSVNQILDFYRLTSE